MKTLPYILAAATVVRDAKAEEPNVAFSDFDSYSHLYALIINGDSEDKRHTSNVSRAKEALEARGIPAQNLYVISDHTLNNPEFGMNHTYSGRSTSLDNAVAKIKAQMCKLEELK